MQFTCAQLAAFGLPGYPTSRQGWHKLVKEQGWEYVELHGKGRGGIRREYIPPAEVIKLINESDSGTPFMLGESLDAPPKARQRKAPYTLSEKTGALLDQQEAWVDAAVQLGIAVRSMEKFARLPDEAIKRISVLAFRFIFLFCDGDMKRVTLWVSDAEKLEGFVRLAYEGDCQKRAVLPGSDL
jgi:hypothetical protein